MLPIQSSTISIEEKRPIAAAQCARPAYGRSAAGLVPPLQEACAGHRERGAVPQADGGARHGFELAAGGQGSG